jgi:para-nitrobenzyl esterase
VAAILAAQTAATMVPNLDGFVLPQTVVSAFATGQFNRVPVIEGSTHDEWRLFVAQTEAATGTPLAAAQYVPAIAATLGVPLPIATAIAAEYPLAAYPSPSVALGAVGTDAVFSCNARISARLLSQFVSTYQYEFNDPNAPMLYFPPVSFPTGAYHASELTYIFDLTGTPVPSPGLHSRAAGSLRCHGRLLDALCPQRESQLGGRADVAAVRDERSVPVAATVDPDDGNRLRRRPQVCLLGFELRSDLG